jgi:hypothetical protein
MSTAKVQMCKAVLLYALYTFVMYLLLRKGDIACLQTHTEFSRSWFLLLPDDGSYLQVAIQKHKD